jgi:hypothetical protein
MIPKVVFKRKGFRGIHGSIGKSVSCTPTFLGSFLLKKHDKAWANDQLRYGIRLLENDPSCGGGPFSGALILAIAIKDNLVSVGWPWQAERLENWINLARARHGFLSGKYHPKPPLRALKELDSVEETEEASK